MAFEIGKIQLTHYPVLLAPLEDITDSAFRRICKHFGADIVYTEFVSSEALVRNAQKSTKKMLFDESERPVGIQIFGNSVESMTQAAIMAETYSPDLIDLNFGCPVKKVVNKGAGAALLQDIPKMLEMTKSVVKAVKIPVTVKTRLGWDESDKPIVDLAEQLQDCGIAAITIHGRTRAQLYSGKADWTLIGQVKNNPRMYIPVIGNGDIHSGQSALEMKNRYGVDAVMIGRAAIGNPFIFSEIHQVINSRPEEHYSLSDRIQVCLQYLQLAAEIKGEYKAIVEARKHYSGYFHSVPGVKNFRNRLVLAKSLSEVIQILRELEQSIL